MKNKPLVTVGIPTYNRSGSLRKTLASIVGQSYKNLEIIVADNASTDPQVFEVVQEFKRVDNRIQYFCHNENKGALYNFQFVLAQSTGEYFMWAADDDWFDNNFIEECRNELSRDADYSIVGGQAIYVDDADKIVLKARLLNLEDDYSTKRLIAYYRHISRAYGNSIFYGLMRKRDIGRAHLSNAFASDSATIAEMSFMGKIKTLNSVHIYYRLGGSSKSIKKMVAAMQLPKWNEWFPGIASARVFIESLWLSDVYRLGMLRKFYLSCRLFFIAAPMFETLRVKGVCMQILNNINKAGLFAKKTMGEKK